MYVYKQFWGKHFFKFDHVITTQNVKVGYNEMPKPKPIPDKEMPSDHFYIEYTLTL